MSVVSSGRIWRTARRAFRRSLRPRRGRAPLWSRLYGEFRRFVHKRRTPGLLLAGFAIAALTPGGAFAGTLRLLALGDSLTAGFQLPEKDSFTVLLEQRLRADGFDIAVSNAGVSGDTASDMLERLDWAMGEHTDFAIVEAGANDMLRGLDPALTKQAIAAILMGLRAKGVRPLLAGMVAAPGMGQPFEANFNAIYPALAAEFGVPLYPFFLDGVAGARGLTQSDGMHPNAAGERVVVERIAPAVEALIRQGVKTP